MFQRIGGTLTVRGKTQPLLGAYVNGATMGFTFVDTDGAIRSVRAQVDGQQARGAAAIRRQSQLLSGRRL